ncbi:MAG: winged helix-turn-helix transcriptional regulator [Candidatus Asgardarchaeia archaeon]
MLVITIKLKTLEQTGALEILIFLLKNKRSRITETLEFLRENNIGQTAMYNALKVLKKAGLIEDTVEGFPRTRYLSLTEKGTRIAEKILEIQKILENEK